MKRNPDFLLRNVAGTQVLVPVGQAADAFAGMVTLNSTSVFLWEQLEDVQTVDSLARALLDRYDVAEEKAREDVEAFLAALMPTGAILEG